MAREVDPKQTRKALRIIRKLAAKSAAPEAIDPETGEVKPGEGAVDYSQWETAFLTEVDKRLEKYGSAFNDLSKGRKDEALSSLQTVKLKEIAAKARGKKRKGMTTKKPLGWKNRPQRPARDES
ncbi:hypothetical protein [Candidatus Viadribacter manganicus]|uniref:Uncharacterized protein n=1 Tax=Candidatus Viadribacter manganicus TaxID=1759059 RepID=A0A1B1AKL6_9PROT|nr:hypothetical protein [Candidatus Viadribacter manganicus]ANP47097.1 hypothetical protein ATE48_14820 [Candidatus Viadribacter manganicus]